ncbi:hypothetical protein, partial [Pseudomonas fulva]
LNYRALRSKIKILIKIKSGYFNGLALFGMKCLGYQAFILLIAVQLLCTILQGNPISCRSGLVPRWAAQRPQVVG